MDTDTERLFDKAVEDPSFVLGFWEGALVIPNGPRYQNIGGLGFLYEES